MKITIDTIPHDQQRYDTCGDWWFDEQGILEIRVDDLGDWRYEFLIAYHELAEVVLCKARGITQQQVDDFDMSYESTRIEGDNSEPGDHPLAPYKNEHFFATNIERLLCAQFGIDWEEYNKKVEGE